MVSVPTEAPGWAFDYAELVQPASGPELNAKAPPAAPYFTLFLPLGYHTRRTNAYRELKTSMLTETTDLSRSGAGEGICNRSMEPVCFDSA